jgi:hypothetical protein
VAQSVFYDYGLALDDLGCFQTFGSAWTSFEKDNDLTAVTVSNLVSTFPLDLTSAAMTHEQWDKNFPNLSITERLGAPALRSCIAHTPFAYCRLGALTLSCSVLLVSRSATVYQNSQYDADGNLFDSWKNWSDAEAKESGEIAYLYFYGAWEVLKKKHKYIFEHEPLFSTMALVNAEPSGIDFFDESEPELWQIHSMEILLSLTAHYVDKIGHNKVAGKKASRGTNSAAVSERAPDDHAATDGSLKGFFGRTMTAITQKELKKKGYDTKERWNVYCEQAGQFFAMDETVHKEGGAFPPFKTFVLDHIDSAPPWVLTKLNELAKEHFKVDTVAEWVQSIERGKKPTTKGARSTGRGGGAPKDRRAPRRRVPAAAEQEENEDDDFDDDDDEEDAITAAIGGMMTQSLRLENSGGKKKVRPVPMVQFQKLQLAVNELADKHTTLSNKVDSLEQKATTAAPTAEDATELGKLTAHNKEMVALMANLATVVSILAPKQNDGATFESLSAIDKMKALTAKALFNGIINTVVNVYKWDTDKQTAFYSSLRGIEEFDEALNKLQEQKNK